MRKGPRSSPLPLLRVEPLIVRSPCLLCPPGLNQLLDERLPVRGPDTVHIKPVSDHLREHFILRSTYRVTGPVALLYALVPPLSVSSSVTVAIPLLSGVFDAAVVDSQPFFCGG